MLSAQAQDNGRPFACSAQSDPLHTAPRNASPWALEVFSDDILEDAVFEQLIGDDRLELPVFIFQSPQSPRIADLHAAKFGFVAVEGGLGDPSRPADFGHVHAGVRLLEQGNDLFFGVLSCSHDSPILAPGSHVKNGPVFRGDVTARKGQAIDLLSSLKRTRRMRCCGAGDKTK